MLPIEVKSTNRTDEKLLIANNLQERAVVYINPSLVDKVSVLSGSMPLLSPRSYAVLLYVKESEIPIPEKKANLNTNPTSTIKKSNN